MLILSKLLINKTEMKHFVYNFIFLISFYLLFSIYSKELPNMKSIADLKKLQNLARSKILSLSQKLKDLITENNNLKVIVSNQKFLSRQLEFSHNINSIIIKVFGSKDHFFKLLKILALLCLICFLILNIFYLKKYHEKSNYKAKQQAGSCSSKFKFLKKGKKFREDYKTKSGKHSFITLNDTISFNNTIKTFSEDDIININKLKSDNGKDLFLFDFESNNFGNCSKLYVNTPIIIEANEESSTAYDKNSFK